MFELNDPTVGLIWQSAIFINILFQMLNIRWINLPKNSLFYQLLSYTDDVDLNVKLEQWENFYNFSRPHGSFKGKTPYEILKYKLK